MTEGYSISEYCIFPTTDCYRKMDTVDSKDLCSMRSPSPPGPQPEPPIVDACTEDTNTEATPQTPPNPALPDLRLPPSSDTFDVGSRYITKEAIGKGAFGYVMSAECNTTGNKVAIKRIKNATSDRVAALRLLRELRFLRQLRGHPNVVSLLDVVVRQSQHLDVYLVMELMEADLEQIIKSSQTLSDEHVRFLAAQMLGGLRHLHQHGVVHRDLKPSNLVVDSFCRLKLCDLGLSRHIRHPAAVGGEAEDDDAALFTDYVVTRWYRAPELLLGSRRYSVKVDTWAAGCVLAELMGRRPLFAGDDPSDMLLRIAAAIGRPSAPDLAALEAQPGLSHGARAFARGLAQRADPLAGRSLHEALPPRPNPEAAALVRALLRWDPAARLSAEAALTHPFLAPLYEPTPAAAVGAAAAGLGAGPAASGAGTLEQIGEEILCEAAVWRR